MSLSRIARPVASVLLAFAVLLGFPLSASAAAPQNVHVVTYDAGGAQEFVDAVNQGAQVWNDNVKNVRLEPANGGAADLTVLADDGWPRAQVEGLGQGTIWMGRQAVNEGHDVIRIAAHEIGHILGLPDNRTGVCADLMSGASAGPDCDNAKPNPDEIAEVEQNFAGGAVIPRRLYLETAPALR
ncbi:snapalysin family zinc-dependent metalloprotease [Saccharopolyspora erythraea]|uniref:snapalysin family zinc-dependent metalloprotease n=1 Tax=Saccharopolyspora erythraea TaxID=1836 RepID=UPI001BA86197|nr:snapalysin family zinc-dependent metalloprotease [Saccharopolyspora erythraea]QUH00521.1 snapalysin family zinc-dependent metalloprotease [Saccharopolyspora erythraea]